MVTRISKAPQRLAAAFLLLGSACDRGPDAQPTQAPDLVGPGSTNPARSADLTTLRLAGTVELPGDNPLSFIAVLEPSDDDDSTYRGTIDIPAQHVRGARLDDVIYEPGTRVSFSLAVPGTAKWSGEFSDEGALMCSFSQGNAHLPCSMKSISVDELAALNPKASRPQTPRGPFPYLEREVVYRNDKADIQLTGTLTVPEGPGPHPAALLITGSGTQDRDETIFEHKPFLVLADSLTRAGVAVLRVDDRGIGGTDKGSADATSADFADDVRAGLAFLRSQPDLDAGHLGLIGHSEGGIIAPMVAADNAEVDFIVMLAGPGVSGHEILGVQVRRLAESAGIPRDQAERQAADNRAITQIVGSEDDDSIRRTKVAAEMRRQAERDGSPSPTDAQIDSAMTTLGSAWFRYFLTHDPATTLERVRCPVLALNGELDVQVDAEQNLPAIGRALAKAGNQHVTIERLPHLNHLFQHAETGAVSEYATIEHTFDPAALKLVTEWVVDTVQRH